MPEIDDSGTSEAPAVILVRPREEGNVGSAARAMANMGLSRLILVEPAAELGNLASMFAVGARFILDGAVRAPSLHQALAPFRRVVATTSSRDRRAGLEIDAHELPDRLAADPPGTPTALVFGPEVGGLTNDELALASLVVTVPCAPVQPTLNLSQAVLILTYELFQARRRRSEGEGLPVAAEKGEPASNVGPPATTDELDGLFDHLGSLLGRIGFARDSSYLGVVRDLRRMAARAVLDSREVRLLRGICRRGEGTIERLGKGLPEIETGR